MNITLLSFIYMLVCFSATSGILRAELPTEEREWTSTAGTTLSASATSVIKGNVQFKTIAGKVINVPFDKLISEDQVFLTEHFKLDQITTPTSSTLDMVTDLKYPVGDSSGPHSASEGSSFYVYIPKTLKKGRKAPLLLFTGASGGNINQVKNHSIGAEINGWIVAANVESSNKTPFEINSKHAERCVDFLIANLPVDPKRVYFTGNSGGGATALYNSNRIPCAGAMPIIAYNSDKKYASGAHYYILGGTTDYNRYLSAAAANGARDRGFHRLYPGGHANPPRWILEEAMTWLNGRYLQDNPTLASERLDWEAAIFEWISDLAESEPHRAHYWCQFMLKSYQITGANAATFSILMAKLAATPSHARYSQGIDAINEFSKKYYANLGEPGGSLFGHTEAKIEAAAAKLAQLYNGVPHIEDVAAELGLKTVAR